MSRHLVRSFLLATALSSFANAGPCQPHPSSALSRSESLTQTVSSYATSSFALIDTTTTSIGTDISATIGTETTVSVTTDATLTTSGIPSLADTIITFSETDTSTPTTSDDSVASTTETASTDTTVTTTGTDTSGTNTPGEPTSTVTDNFTSTTESIAATSETSSAAGPACTPGFPISPSPQGVECDKKGTIADRENLLSWWSDDSDQRIKSIDNCYNDCKNTPDCGSIAFSKDLFCEIWKGKPGETTNDQTTHGWYDVKCFCGEDTPEPEPVCVDNSSTEKVCGVNGFALGQCMHKIFSSRVNGIEACREACKTNNCDSFSYRDENDECEGYQGRVGGAYGSSSPRKWYDVACFDDENTATDPDP